MKPFTEKINEKLLIRFNVIRPIISNHSPDHLSAQVENLAHIRTMGIMPVINNLCDRDFLKGENFIDGITTIGWVVLKDK